MTPLSEQQVLSWLKHGEVGLSSKEMALVACPNPWLEASFGSFSLFRPYYPRDPDDLNRCRMLVEAVPEIRNHFPAIAELCPEWKQIIDHWDELMGLLKEELPARKAPTTYSRMRALLDGVKA